MSQKNPIKKAVVLTRLMTRSENYNEGSTQQRAVRRPKGEGGSVVYRHFSGTLFTAYHEGSIKNMEYFLKVLPNEDRRKILNEKRKEFKMHTILFMAVKEEKPNIVKYLWDMGARDPDAYELAKKKGGDILSIMEPKLAGIRLSIGECDLCCDTAAMFKLNCGHSYCYDCIQKWIENSVHQMPPTIPNCHECNQSITNQLEYFLDKKEIEQFNIRILNYALSTIPGFKRCPNCNYGFIDQSSSPHCTTLTCKECDYQWCRNCNLPLHSDLTCDQAIAKQSVEIRQNQEWFNHNTQKCPQCSTMIQKNQGCNHMTCRYCQYEFCWICKSKWIPEQLCIH